MIMSVTKLCYASSQTWPSLFTARWVLGFRPDSRRDVSEGYRQYITAVFLPRNLLMPATATKSPICVAAQTHGRTWCKGLQLLLTLASSCAPATLLAFDPQILLSHLECCVVSVFLPETCSKLCHDWLPIIMYIAG